MLSKNEQIVIFVLTFLVIAVAGTIFFVMPSRSAVNSNKTLRADKQAQLHQLQEDYSTGKVDQLEAEVTEAYNTGNSVSVSFYEEMSEYQADRVLRNFLKDVKDPYTDYKDSANIDTDNLVLTGLATETFALNMFVPPEITYPIKDMAQSGAAGTLPPIETTEDLANLTSDALILLMRGMTPAEAVTFYEENKAALSPFIQAGMREVLAGNSETVAVQKVTFKIPLTSYQANAVYMSTLRNDKAVIVDSVVLSDITPELENEGEGEGGEGGGGRNTTITVGEREIEIKPYSPESLYEITLAFFCVERMGEPVFNPDFN